MTAFVSSDPLDNLTNLIQRPITIPAKRAPTINDIQPPNTCWVDGSVNPPVLYYSNGAGTWAPGGSGSGLNTLTGTSGGAISPTLGNITFAAGTNMTSIVGSGSTLTFNAAGAGSSFVWSVIGASQTLVAANGYFCTTGGALVLTLPAVSAIGATIEVVLDGSTSWQIAQNAGNQIRIGNQQTTAGAGGSLTSTGQGNALTLVCETANARWVATKINGNITVV